MVMRCWVMAFLLAWGSSSRAEIYRWVDEHGEVVYGSRPPPGRGEAVQLRDQGGAAARPVPDVFEREERRRRLLETYEYERERKRAEKARDDQRAAERARDCDRLKRRWRRFSYGGPIYYPREGGGRRYIDEAERNSEKARMLPAYRRACGEDPA